MNTKSIIREIKLSKLLNEPLSGDALIINDFFNDLLDGIKMVSLDKYPNSIFFTKSDSVYYMRYNGKTNKLHCSYIKIWEFFKSNMIHDNDIISYLVKEIIEDRFKLDIGHPVSWRIPQPSLVENLLRQGKGKPVFLPEYNFD